MTMTFRGNQHLHSGKEFLEDKTYNPLAYMVLSEFARQKSYFKKDRHITPQEKNDLLRRDLGYSPQKITSILDSLVAHEEISITSDGNIIINEFDTKKKQYVTLDAITAQYFYDTFEKNSLALKIYVYLGGKWLAQQHLKAFSNGFQFTKGGMGKMSIIKNLGYKTNSQNTRDNLDKILDRLIKDGLISVSGPYSCMFGTMLLGYTYSLDYWGPCINGVITSINTSDVTHPTKRFTYDIHRLSKYYMDASDSRYEFTHDIKKLGKNAVAVLYEDVDDDSLIKLLDEYPRELDIPSGKIMYSTLEPMDDDYDMT